MDLQSPARNPLPSSRSSLRFRHEAFRSRILLCLHQRHSQLPYIRRIPLPALLIVAFIAFANCMVWAICGLVLSDHETLVATAALAYTLGLRHALDADHISAIDLMTRRLLAGNSRCRPVTVGTWFSLGHSTIVVITSIVVAATTAGVSKNFGSFSTVGGIIGSSVSAGFLIILALMNGYILYKLVLQLRMILALPVGHESDPVAFNVEGGGPLFRILKRLFKIIDRPWKMYPLGIMFGLGFDTSSEVALLGISSIQATKGTSIWLIMVFPILFTAGMCLIDTIDGALMLALYVGPMQASGIKDHSRTEDVAEDVEHSDAEANRRLQDPVVFLYYSIILTCLTVVFALIIGTIQLLTLILNVTNATGPFWDGVQAAGDNYEIIGGAICGSFIIFGGLSVLCYKPWRRKMEEGRQKRDFQSENTEDVAGIIQTEVEIMSKGSDESNKDIETGTGAEPSKNKDLLDDLIKPA